MKRRASNKGPEEMVREIISWCTDCDCCRGLMDDNSCLFFPELFRLYDRTEGHFELIAPAELRSLIELCNACGMCPCSNVRTDIREAKDAFVARDGLPSSIRILEDVQRLGKFCGVFPRLANVLLAKNSSASVLKHVAGIHPNRTLPVIPQENFATWASKRGLNRKSGGMGRKAAYFVGCTAKYLFPSVAKAVVAVLEHNGIEVYVPEQKCCGMPSLLEGDQPFTFELAGFNLESLCNAVDEGYDIVCSCPTCGYVLTKVLSDGVDYSKEPQALVRKQVKEANGDPEEFSEIFSEVLFNDHGYFSSLNGLRRIKLSVRTFDLGEYLKHLAAAGELKAPLTRITGRIAYFPPCHLREQQIGLPWWDLLASIPGIAMEKVGGDFDCCGMAGIMGFKKDFYESSLAMGTHVFDKIRKANPGRLVTDCLSCRMQFNHAVPYEVLHPVEILREAYGISK